MLRLLKPALWVIISCLFSQATAQTGWTQLLLGPECFIENQGQYDHLNDLTGAPVRFAADYGFGWQAYFTATGVGFQIRKMDYTVEEMETFHCEPSKGTVSQTFITAEWVGMSPVSSLTTKDITPDYYTFCYASGSQWIDLSHVSAYRKLVYEGIYPNTDIEYTAPKEGGIKYTIRLHPGANPANLKLRYSGSSVTMDSQGNLRMSTVLGDLVDHAPSAWYADNPAEKIPVSFVLNGNEVTFSLGTYNTSREVVIDPWTVNPALPAPFNRAFEVDVDNSGNVYVWGGGMGYNLKKYNSAGTLQWTHVSPWDTSNAWFGELLTLPSGDCFITSGSPAKIRRLTTAGATTFTNNGPFFNLDEYWNLTLNCDQTKLIAGGSRIISLTSPQGHLFNLNPANGNQLAGSPYNISRGFMKELRGLTVGADGYLYAMGTDSIIKLDNSFGVVYKTNMGFNYPYYSPQYMANAVQGVNNIDASNNFLYTTKGDIIQRRNLASGALLSTAGIGGSFTTGLGGSGNSIGGCVVDNAGNVYAGGFSGSDVVYQFNSTLGVISTTGVINTVYDLVVSPLSRIIVGGNAFVSSLDYVGISPKTVVCPILPMTLDFFAARCSGNGIQISWKTLEENNIQQFSIERAMDNLSWVNIADLSPSSSGATTSNYSWTDPFSIPGGAVVHYRLKAIDNSGSVQYSGISTIERCGEGASQLVVYPTITDRYVAAQLLLEKDGAVRIDILNAIGQVVHTITYPSITGMNTLAIDLEGLPSSVYHLRIQLPDGSLAGTPVKVVKE